MSRSRTSRRLKLLTRSLVGRSARRCRLFLEELETRLTPSTLYWLGGATSDWNADNWASSPAGVTTGLRPLSGDALVFDASNFNSGLSSASNFFNPVNDIAGSLVLAIHIVDNDATAGHDFTLSGNGINLLSLKTSGNDGSGREIVSLTLAGSGAVTQHSAGTLVLAGADTYTGATTIKTGTLQQGANNVLPSTTAVTVAAEATLDLNNDNATIGSLAGAGNVILSGPTATGGTVGTGTLGSGTDALTIDVAGTDLFSGVISATTSMGGVIKAGPGTLTLAGANTYFLGFTQIDAGTLQLGVANALPFNTDVTVAAGATLDLNNINATIGSLAGAGNVTLGSGTLTTGGDNAHTTFSGVISGTGGLTYTSGQLFFMILSGANTYSGPTTIIGGRLQVGDGGTSGRLGIGAISDNGTLVIDRSDALSLVGAISGIGALDQEGSGITTLSRPNTYTGATTINFGTLQLGAENALPSGTFVRVASGATLDLNNNNATLSALMFGLGSPGGTGNVNLGLGTLTVEPPGLDFFSGRISGTGIGGGGLVMAGTGSLILTGAFNMVGTVTVSHGDLSIAPGSTLNVGLNFYNFASVTLLAGAAGGGIIRVGGNYIQSAPTVAGAMLTVQLAGTPASGQFGQLILTGFGATGTADLATTLFVELVNGYTPSHGDSFRILTDFAVSGNFGTENLPAGFVWDPKAGTVTFP